MNIVDALIQKGSTGGNNIAEAVENLPDISGGGSGSGSGGESGGVFWIKPEDVFNSLDGNQASLTVDVTFEEIVAAYNSGLDLKVLGLLTSYPGGRAYTVLSLEDVNTNDTTGEPMIFYLRSHQFSGPYGGQLQKVTFQVTIGASSITGMKSVVNISAST